MTFTSLTEHTDFLCGTNSNSYPIADKTRSFNRWYLKAILARMKAAKGWQTDDSNYTDFAISTTTLVAGQNDYTLPTTLLKLERIEVKDAAGNYSKLEPIDQADIKGSLTDFEETDGLPKYYDIVGNSVMLYPAPASGSVTTSEGLKVFYLRKFDEFTTSDTTQEPGIPVSHEILSFGAARDWVLVHDTARVNQIDAELVTLFSDLTTLTADQNREVKTAVRPAHRTNNYL